MLDHVVTVRSLGLPEGSYLIIGGSCLAIHGIRESNDIDIVVTPEQFEKLREQGWEIDQSFKQKWGRERLTRGPFEVYTEVSREDGTYVPAAELIPKAEMIDGLPFMPLIDVIFFKQVNGRPKDIQDIALIEDYLQSHA
jgi:hypothetical protein